MRDQLLTIATLLAVSTACFQDAVAAERLYFGALGGASATSAAWTPQPDFDVTSRTRMSGGVLLGFDITGVLSLEARALWLEKAVNLSTSLQGGGSGGASISYVAVPLLGKLRFNQPKVAPYILAGAELGFRTSAESWTVSFGQRWDDPEFEDDVDTKDVSLDVGAGVEIPAGPVHLLLEGLYSHGVRDIALAPDEEVKIRTFRVSAGVRF